MLSATSKIIEQSLINHVETEQNISETDSQKYFFSSRKRPRDSTVLITDKHLKRGKTLKIPDKVYDNSTKTALKTEEDEYYSSFGWMKYHIFYLLC